MKETDKIAGFALILLMLLMPSACSDDFLDKPLQGELTQEFFPSNANDAFLATNAVYNTLRNWFYNYGGYPIYDIMSDDALKGSNPSDGAATIGPYEDFSFNTNADGLERWWNTLYEGIKRTNVVIEKVPEISMNADLKARYIAEAKFFRALFYFDLVTAWGGGPIITSTEPPTIVDRATREEVNALIEADLTEAIENLPTKNEYGPNELGRATRDAAKALLGKVFLYQNNFTQAETYFLEVINSGLYALDTDFIRTHSEEGEFNAESVFEVNAIPLDGTVNGGSQWGNVQGVRGNPNRGWGFNRPSLDLINAFQQNQDPRLEGTVIFLGDEIDGIPIVGDSQTPDEVRDENDNLIEIESYNRKVWVTGTRVVEQWGHNRRIIRYADVLLMAAEASAQNNNIPQALNFLNEVRRRARGNNPDVLPDITETNPAMLLESIYDERRFELALEGHRYPDLIRTGKAVEVLGAQGFTPGKHELLPIPQVEIDLTEGRMQQNPGWN